LAWLEFGGSKRPIFYLDLIYFIYCTAVSFYCKLAEVPGVARGNLKIELRQKIFLAFVIRKGIHEFPF